MHKMNLIVFFSLPVLDFYQSCLFLPFRSYPATLALYSFSSYICLPIALEHQCILAPGPLHVLFSFLCNLLSSSPCSVLVGSFWFCSKVTSSERLSLATLLNRPPTLYHTNQLSPAHPTPSCHWEESSFHNRCT